MTYIFQPGERIIVSDRGMNRSDYNPAARVGAVKAWLPASGPAGADGIRVDRVRVKLDSWPRAMTFLARDASPL